MPKTTGKGKAGSVRGGRSKKPSLVSAPNRASKWTPISTNPPESGLYLVCARSADPDMPFRHLAFFHMNSGFWSGLVPPWLKALTHWMPYPELPEALKARKKGKR